MYQKKPLVLMILDGWGHQDNHEHNAIAAAHTPQWDSWWQNNPHSLLNASGEIMGLPANQMGNSEVGHMHIGAGRTVYQDFTRINQAIENGQFNTNSQLLNIINRLKENKRSLHVMGLLSPGGVHSHENHLFALLKLCFEQQFKHVVIHLFLDGRDTPPISALQSIKRLEQSLEKYPVGKISSIAGRYFAMDRDKRWDRTLAVYDLLTQGVTLQQFADVSAAIEYYYADNINDEFIPPTVIGQAELVKDGDAIFFFNFRADRARQLTEAFISPGFNGFFRQKIPQLLSFVSMTRYSKQLATAPAFPPQNLNNSLGELVANEGLTQLRIAETEKYAHVTFFLNGGSEQVFPNEDRVLVPSPGVATYDLKPEMSAPELTRSLVAAIKSNAYDLIICNYANADMVGHTGNFSATVKAVECLDNCMKTVWEALKLIGGTLVITADHGNAEMMFDPATNQAHTAHSTGPVPFVYVGSANWQLIPREGSLIDIAPTVLALLNIPKPPEMSGNSLLSRING